MHAGIGQNPGHLGFLAAVVVVIAEHCHDGHRHRGQRLGHELRLLGVPPVGQVAAERQDIGVLRYLSE